MICPNSQPKSHTLHFHHSPLIYQVRHLTNNVTNLILMLPKLPYSPLHPHFLHVDTITCTVADAHVASCINQLCRSC